MSEPRTPATAAGRALLADIRELAGAFHQVGSLRDHADPNDKTGWNVHGIETCEDPYCMDALTADAAILAIEAEAHSQINVAAIAEALDYIEDEWMESGRLADRLSVKSSWDIAAAVMDRLREQAERGASRSAARPTP